MCGGIKQKKELAEIKRNFLFSLALSSVKFWRTKQNKNPIKNKTKKKLSKWTCF